MKKIEILPLTCKAERIHLEEKEKYNGNYDTQPSNNHKI